MPELPVSPQLLDDLIEGRLAYASPTSEASQLVRLARQCATLRIAGPGPAAESRMRSRFSAALEEHRRRPHAFLGLAGLPPMPALRHRLAALALTMAVAGSAASYTTGIGPMDAIEGVVDLARSLVANLAPGGGEPGAGIGATTVTPATATAPASTGTPTAPASVAEPTVLPQTPPLITPRPATEPGNDASAQPPATPGAPSPAAATPTPAATASTPGDPTDDPEPPEPTLAPPPENGAAPDGPLPTPAGTTTPPPGSTPDPEPTSAPDDDDGEPDDDHDEDDEDDEDDEPREPGDGEEHD